MPRKNSGLAPSHMLRMVRQLLGLQLTVAELIGIGLIVGTPYLLIGAIWSTTHTEHLHQMHGIDRRCPSSGPSCCGRCCCSRTSA